MPQLLRCSRNLRRLEIQPFLAVESVIKKAAMQTAIGRYSRFVLDFAPGSSVTSSEHTGY